MAADASTIDSVIAVFQQAAAANAADPSRRGCLIQLDEQAEEVLVGADLHGHRLNYQRILALAELPRAPRRQLILQEVCHGGPAYPGAGACMSHLLLEDVARLKVERPRQVHFLLSNHELAESQEQPIIKGSRMVNLQFRLGLEQLYGAAAGRVHAAASEFIRSCPLAVRTANRIWISHSAPGRVVEEGFDAGVFRRQLSEADLAVGGAAHRVVWDRDFRQQNADAVAALVDADLLVHGHEPCDAGYQIPNSRQLILDSSKSPGCCLLIDTRRPATMDQLREGIRFL